MIDALNKLPKVELHLHLDGSLNIEKISKKYGIDYGKLREKMTADAKCENLNDYLTKFDYPISIMQTKKEIEDAVIDLLEELKKQNVIYAEIRFAPQFHTKKGLTQEEVIQSVLEAREKVDIKSNFILCFMRGNDNMNDNYETLLLAKKYLGQGVCALDLAGAEGIYPTENYRKLFEEVNKYSIPFTIHAGEASGYDSIKSAISFGAKRIGHGVKCADYPELIEEIKSKNITLEVCPTSNIQTCICDSYINHPISKLYNMGILTTINTDNMTVSNTTLVNEYIHLMEEAHLKLEDIIRMNKNSIDAAFISSEEKQKLHNRMDELVNE